MISALFAATLATVQAAAVAPPTPEAEQEIVVSGQADRQKQARKFVKALTSIEGTDPLARFDYKPTCPAAVGLTDALDAAITARLRLIAKTAGVELAQPGCAPNVLVLFAPSKQEMVNQLRRKHPEWFQAPDGMVSVANEPGPALAWHLEGRVDRSGVPVPFDPTNGYYVLDTPVAASRTNASMRPVLLGSVVVIEQDGVIGFTTTQVADYAAMRAFARTEPGRLKKAAAATILTALETPMGGAAPESLTRWDLGYLRGLYSVEATHHAQRQKIDIARSIERSLEGADGR